MIDPLAEVVGLLRPAARYAKVISGAGRWGVRRVDVGDAFYGVVLSGTCHLRLRPGAETEEMPCVLEAGDFVLIPSACDFEMSSHADPTAADFAAPRVEIAPDEFRLGDHQGAADVHYLVGHCTFASADAALLLSLLPRRVHVQGDARLRTLVELIGEETHARRPARDVVLGHLLEVLFIEALRSAAMTAAAPGLLRGLADERVASAIRSIHEDPAATWTVARLAKLAALSRSAFFERFSRTAGVAPMRYLLNWRMALAKNLLRESRYGVAEVAQKVGYRSASSFSVAFTRYAGLPPIQYARTMMEAAEEVPEEARLARAAVVLA